MRGHVFHKKTVAAFLAISVLSAGILTTWFQAKAENDFVSRLLADNFWKSPSDHSVMNKPRRRKANQNYCVRLCDGYYWPISPRISRRRGAELCQASCSSPAELYRIPSSSQTTKDMVNLKGGRYGDLPAAFVYRKTYNPSCSCRPAPWTAEAKKRHTLYAEAEKNGTPIPRYANIDGRNSSNISTSSISTRTSRSRQYSNRRRQTVRRRSTATAKRRDSSWMKNIFGN